MPSRRIRFDRPLRVDLLCEGVIEASWLAVLVLTPVFFLVYSDRPFDPSKASLIRVLAVTAVAAWFSKVLTGGRPWRPVPASATALGTRIARWLIAAVLLSCMALVVSAALSIDPRMSWHGSYLRSLGVSTGLAAAVFFLMCVGHLRDRRQMLRFLGVVWWGSVPVCLYTLLQSLGFDPVERGSELVRPGSTLGNPIFLGAYLGIAFFLGLALLAMVLRRESVAAEHGLRQGVLICICGLQAWALATASSRGPVLGVLVGMAFLGWLVFLRRPWRRDATGGWPGWRRVLAVGLLLVFAGVAIPVLRHTREGSSESRESGSDIGRLVGLVDPESGTARVRLLVWRGALNAFAAPAPLPSAQAEDRRHAWRPWVGYGSGSAGFALGHHEPVELERLEPDRPPDHAHNVVLQTLVAGGIGGLVVWCFVQLLTLATGAVAFGVVRTRAELVVFSAVVGSGSALGALLPWIGLGESALAALGGVAGGLTAYFLWMSRLWRLWSDQFHSGMPNSLVLGGLLLAAWLSHLVEGQFGIQVTTLMVYGMTTLAAFLVVASGWLAPLDSSRGEIEEPRTAPGTGVVGALFTAILVFVFLIARHDASELVWSRMEHQHAASWLVLASVAAGLALVEDRRGLLSAIGGAVIGGVGMLLVLHTVRKTGSDRFDAGLASVAPTEADLVAVVLAGVVVLTIAWGWRLSSGRAGAERKRTSAGGPYTWIRIAVIAPCCVVFVVGGWFVEARSLRAPVLVEGAMSLSARLRFTEAAEVMQRVRRVFPMESRLALLQGRILFDEAQDLGNQVEREQRMIRARAALDEALDLAPFDADHVANLGRWHLAAARFEGETAERETELVEAVRGFERALEMRPAHLTWRRELAEVMRLRGDLDGAIENLETVIETLTTDIELILDLAELQREKASRARVAGDDGLARAGAGEAVRLADLALALDPENRRALRAVASGRDLLANGDYM